MNLQHHNIVILTGAGISAESGIETFRANDGLWMNHKVEDIATPEGFARNPALVQAFYNNRRQQINSGTIQPNPAHLALAELEQQLPNQVLLVTQNIDNLHERAGSKNLIHMHGELNKVRCTTSKQVFDWTDDVTTDTVCPCCLQTGTLRPDIVWFGEMPMQMETIHHHLEAAHLFISIGTSGHVYPAAGFVEVARLAGAYAVELNLEPSLGNNHFDESIHGLASQIVPEYVRTLLNKQTG